MNVPLELKDGATGSEPERWLLVVEDNPNDEYLARRAYKALNRPETLVVATNGEEAVEILRSRAAPAVVILDLKLPRLSGVGVLMTMKDDERLRTVPVVVLTSSSEMTDLGACCELGCNAFVQKPVDYQEFMAAITSTFDFWLNHNLTFAELVQGAVSVK
jgi:two-component system response regulator